MSRSHIVQGFSKRSREEKLEWLSAQTKLSEETRLLLDKHLHPDPQLQEIYGDISENTVTNYYLPLGLAPNFLVNDTLMVLPMVTEESSVIAAAAHAAKFWAGHGGFRTRVEGMLKVGQVHFTWNGPQEVVEELFSNGKSGLLEAVEPITGRMVRRGGGIEEIRLVRGSPRIPGYYQLFVTFRTADAMGANFINSVLEGLAESFTALIKESVKDRQPEVVMSILSNYTPECLVHCYLEGDTGIFGRMAPGMSGEAFARKFKLAVDIAEEEIHRAVTHNKGIFNGMDAVVMATGNDFRAVEACGHAYAARNGHYRSLTEVECSEGTFRFSLRVPVAVGTVGGLTGTHPMAAASLEILGNPDAETLMQIIAAAGLANNFSAIRSLVTTGIQRGHMKMHLGNILRQLNASREQSELAAEHFRERPVSHAGVAAFIEDLRNKKKTE